MTTKSSNDKATVESVEGIDKEEMKRKVREGLDTARHKVADGYEKVSEKAHEVWDKAADKTLNDVVHSVKDYVRHKPAKSLMIAAGTGLLVGLLLRGHRG